MGKDKAQRVDHGGKRSEVPHAVLDSDAWASLSMRARCILIALFRRHNGYNNGRIAASSRDLAAAIGSHRYASNKAAIGELWEAGFVEVVRVYPRGSRMATEYRLTFIQTGQGSSIRAATNEYRKVRRKHRKKEPLETSTRKRKQVDAVSTDGKCHVDGPSTVTTETSQKYDAPPVDDASAHIITRSVPSWMMELDDLRQLARGYCEWAGAGSQTQVAKAASIPGGTLSKFLSGKGLAAHHRRSLQLEVGKRWPVDQRPVDVGGRMAHG